MRLLPLIFISFIGISIKNSNKTNNNFSYTATPLFALKTDGGSELDDFVDQYMHMDETDNNGYCSDEEHNYYGEAKEAFENLTNEQRKTFSTDPRYSDAYTRFTTWAGSNGESVYVDEQGNVYFNKTKSIIDNEKKTVNYIIAASATTLILITSVLIIFVIKKKT